MSEEPDAVSPMHNNENNSDGDGLELGNRERRLTRLGSVENNYIKEHQDTSQGFVTELFPHAATAHFVGFSPDWKTFCSGGEGGQLVLYDAVDNSLQRRWKDIKMKDKGDDIIKIRSMCFTNEGMLCLGGMDGSLSLFNPDDFEEMEAEMS